MRLRLSIKWHRQKPAPSPIQNYGPDVGLSAADYVMPVPPGRRLAQAEKRIDDFLDHTEPDRFSGGFFDDVVEQEEKLIIALLEEQFPDHDGTNGAIALKHASELVRLRSTIRRAGELMASLDDEIAKCQTAYDQANT